MDHVGESLSHCSAASHFSDDYDDDDGDGDANDPDDDRENRYDNDDDDDDDDDYDDRDNYCDDHVFTESLLVLLQITPLMTMMVAMVMMKTTMVMI